MRLLGTAAIAAVALAGVLGGRRPRAASTFAVVVVRDNRQHNGTRSVSTHTVETGYFHLSFAGTADHLTGSLVIDSATFLRDGSPRPVLPKAALGTTIGFSREAFRYRIDSVPSIAAQYPFVSTVGLELPYLLPPISLHTCGMGNRWSDSAAIAVHPAPVGDSIVQRSRASFVVTSAGHEETVVQSIVVVNGWGYTGGGVMMHQRETRSGVWHLSSSCAPPGTFTETRDGYIAFHARDGSAVDTLYKTESRRLSLTR